MLIELAIGKIQSKSATIVLCLQLANNMQVRKEMILSTEDLKSFQNHSSQMAALDYLVSIASDFFLPTYDGNMAKVVEGHRR